MAKPISRILNEKIGNFTTNGIAENSLTEAIKNDRTNLSYILTYPILGSETGVTDVRYEYGNIKRYGAVGDGTADDTTAIQNAINSSLVVYVPTPSNYYKITSTINARKTGLKFYGASPSYCRIVQATNNISIITTGGERIYISDLKFEYVSLQSVSNTGAFAIEVHSLYESVITRCYINNAYIGIGIAQNDDLGTGNYLYGCEISNLRIANYTGYALYIKPVNAYNSGNVFSNIYTVNRQGLTNDVGTGICGMYFQGTTDGIYEQLNIEWSKLNNAIVFNECRNATICGVHFEGIVPISDYNGFIDVVNSVTSLFISGLEITNCSILAGNVANRYAVFRAALGVTIFLINCQTSNITLTTSNFNFVYSASCTDAELTFINIKSSSITAVQNLPASTTSIPQVKRYNNEYYYLHTPAKIGTISFANGYNNYGSGNWFSAAVRINNNMAYLNGCLIVGTVKTAGTTIAYVPTGFLAIKDSVAAAVTDIGITKLKITGNSIQLLTNLTTESYIWLDNIVYPLE